MKKIILLPLLILFCYPSLSEINYMYKAKVITDRILINVYHSPDTTFVLFKLPKDSELYVLGEAEDWVEIETTRGSEGWMLKKFIQKLPDDYLFAKEKYISAKQERIQELRDKQFPPKRPWFQAGPKLFINSSQLINSSIGGKTGVEYFGAGVAVLFNFNRFHAIQIGGNFMSIGGIYHDYSYETSFKIHSFITPIIYQYRFKHLQFGVGGFFTGFFDRNSNTSASSIPEGTHYIMKKYDYGYVFDIGFAIGHKFNINVGLYMGRRDIIQGSVKFKNINWTFGLCYYLF